MDKCQSRLSANFIPRFSPDYPQGYPQVSPKNGPRLRKLSTERAGPYAYNQGKCLYMSRTSWFEALGRAWGKGWEEQEAVWRWREAVGEGLSRLARPLYVDKGVLHLAVQSPVVANELRLWSREIVARLAEIAPKSAVKELRFRVVAEKERQNLPCPAPTGTDLRRAEKLMPQDIPAALREKFLKLVAWALVQEEAILSAGGKKCRSCGVAFFGEEEDCPLCRLS